MAHDLAIVRTLRTHKVTYHDSVGALAALGLLLWASAFATYVCGAAYHVDTVAGDVYAALSGAHVLVGGLVVVDAVWLAGRFWPLQTVVVGTGTSITLSLPALGGAALAHDDRAGVALALGALALACYANATMVSVLFELFHRGIAPSAPSAPLRAEIVVPRRSGGRERA